jgi:hypothetical protein
MTLDEHLKEHEEFFWQWGAPQKNEKNIRQNMAAGCPRPHKRRKGVPNDALRALPRRCHLLQGVRVWTMPVERPVTCTPRSALTPGSNRALCFHTLFMARAFSVFHAAALAHALMEQQKRDDSERSEHHGGTVAASEHATTVTPHELTTEHDRGKPRPDCCDSLRVGL